MAQIREFESTTESYFILDGVSYPKVYEAMLDNGYSDTKIKLVGTNRDTTPLVFSTEYTNIRVDDVSFDTALEAISRLNQIVFSKGGGSGTGGATNVITEDSDTVTFTGNGTAGNPLSAESVGGGTEGKEFKIYSGAIEQTGTNDISGYLRISKTETFIITGERAVVGIYHLQNLPIKKNSIVAIHISDYAGSSQSPHFCICIPTDSTSGLIDETNMQITCKTYNGTLSDLNATMCITIVTI